MKRYLKDLLTILPYLIKNLYFNFHYLPFKQALCLPIWLYKPKFGILSGSLSICYNGGGKIRPGMIRLGFNNVALYPSTGIHIQIAGGTIEFRGQCSIGNNSFIAVGRKGKLVFGDNFTATSSIKIACQYQITFDENVLCGWETMFVDSDFHRLKYSNGVERETKPYGPILIGKNCWLGFKTIVMKNCTLPNNCVVSSNSMVVKTEGVNEYSLLAGQPAKVVRIGLFRDPKGSTIQYYE